MLITRSFEKDESPLVDFTLRGPLQEFGAHEFTGILDTGFLAVPLLKAFPIGLILRGVMSSILADGSTQPTLYCLGQAEINGESKIGIVSLLPSDSDILVGMDFLRKFDLKMTVDSRTNMVQLDDGDQIAPHSAAEEEQ